MDRLSDRTSAAPILAFPVAIADHGHQWRSGLVVFAGEEPTSRWLQAERLVVAAGDERAGRSTDRFARADI